MSSFINTNVLSLNAQRNLTRSSGDMATAMQRLSTGLRINSAKDDAAGLAISERFTTQVRGINMAIRNANDGISLSQTAEGALVEVTNNLQRIRELAVQAANATNSESDRAAINNEVQQRLAEMDRLGAQTSFNGRNILDGSFGGAAFQIGANVGQTINLSLETSMRTNAIGAVATATSLDLSTLVAPGSTGVVLAAGALTVGGSNVAAGTYTTAAELASAINATGSGLTATASGNEISFRNDTTGAIALGGSFAATLGVASVDARSPTVENIASTNFTGGPPATFTVTALSVNGTGIANQAYSAADLITAINTAAAATIASADGSGGINITNDTTSAIVFAGANATALLGAGNETVAARTAGSATSADLANALTANNNAIEFTVNDNFSVQIGSTGTALNVANATYTTAQSLVDALNTALGSNARASLDTATNTATITASEDVTVTGAQGLAVFTAGSYQASGDLTTANVLTVAAANTMLSQVDSALTSVNSLRATFGAIQNRFESTISSLQTTSENLSASRSRIQDADFAAETAALTRAQILQQAGVAMLSQANAQPQNVLALLRG